MVYATYYYCLDIDDVAVQHVAQDAGLTRLSLSGCYKVSDVGLQAACEGLPRLQTLNLSDCSYLTPAGLVLLQRLPQLSTLGLARAGAGEGALAAVGRATALTSLDLSFSDVIDAAGLAHLASLSRLSRLNLVCCSNLDDASLMHLCMLPALQSLCLDDCSVTETGRQQFDAVPWTLQ